MQKKPHLYLIGLMAVALPAFADDTPVANANDSYINSRNFLQNPYGALPSGGGTQTLVESQVANQNIMEKWFADGTWNVWGTSAFNINNGLQPNYEYGANLFGQTGQVGGFSFGGLFTVINPYFSSQMNAPAQTPPANQFLPSTQQVGPSEAFIEYQYSNVVQMDAGYIGINNSPWLAGNYYNNMAAPAITYQGVLVNVNPGGGWVLTGLGFNAAQPSGQNGFDGLTLYNTGFDWATGTGLTSTAPSSGTFAVGGNFMGWNNNENFRVWWYQFENYANLWYADNNIKFKINNDLTFNLGGQLGTEAADFLNTLKNNGLGSPNSTFFGLQGGFNYKWFGLNLAYNNAWGSQNSFGQGAIVSPYTYGVGLDPLFTTPYMQGLVDRASGGQAFKVTPSFTFLDGNLSITPAITQIQTVAYPTSIEYDFQASYSIPQVKGLTLFAAYAYQSVPYYSNAQQQASGGNSTGGSSYTTQFFASYLY